MAAAFRDVEAATLALDGSPPITRITFPTCRAHYPGGSNGCACRLLPRSCCLPLLTGGSASALGLSRPAQASLTLRPTGLLNRLKRPLSRGSSPAGYPTEPLVSYQINRQLSGWNLPPLVIRAFGAHGQKRRFDAPPTASGLPQSTDIIRPAELVRLVPLPDSCTAAMGGHIHHLVCECWKTAVVHLAEDDQRRRFA